MLLKIWIYGCVWRKWVYVGQPLKLHCEFHLNKHSISVVRKAEQLRATKLILKCAAARRSGRDDSAVELHPLKAACWRNFYWTPKRLQEARFYYFIGSVLRHDRPEQARLYFWSAVRSWFRTWELGGGSYGRGSTNGRRAKPSGNRAATECWHQIS